MTDALTITKPVLGLQVTAQDTPDWSVNVTGGTALIANRLWVVSGPVTVTPTVAHATKDRIDAIVIDSSGNAVALTGSTSDDNNVQPPDTSGYALLAYVFVVSQASADYTGTITSDVITDRRDFVALGQPTDSQAYTFDNTALSATDPGAGVLGFDSTLNSSIAHMYLSVYNGVGGAPADWFGGAGGSGTFPMPYYVRLWSRQAPWQFWLGQVTAIAGSHTTWLDLAVSFVYQSASTNGPTVLTTDPWDTILEWAGPVPPAAPPVWTLVTKTSDTSRSSTTSLTADPDLQFAMDASTTYLARGLIRWASTSTAPGFKFDFNGPASPTRVLIVIRSSDQGTAPVALVPDTAFGTAHTQATAASGAGVIEFDAIIQNGSNAGTFAFRWAQNNTSAVADIVRTGSWLEYQTA